MANQVVRSLKKQLRSPDYHAQAAAAYQLGELADPAAERALLQAFWANTYSLIDSDGSPGSYFAILSSAAEALAKLDTPRAFSALSKKLREGTRWNDQLGVAAAVYGISFSPRPGMAELIRAVRPNLQQSDGDYLADEQSEALARIDFADFLVRVVEGTVDASEFLRRVTTSSSDSTIEQVRSKLSQLSLPRDQWTAANVSQVQIWLRLFRGRNSPPPAAPTPSRCGGFFKRVFRF